MKSQFIQPPWSTSSRQLRKRMPFMDCVYKKATRQIDKSRYLSKVCLLPAGHNDKEKIIVCIGFCWNIKSTDFMPSCSSLLSLTDKVYRHIGTNLHIFCTEGSYAAWHVFPTKALPNHTCSRVAQLTITD